MNILILENNSEITHLLSEQLEKNGHNVAISKSVREVINKGWVKTQDLIIIDLTSKKKRGNDLVNRLRRKGIKKPIMVLSAFSDVQYKVNILRLGADDYITKPFDIEELLARIDILYRKYLEFTSNFENKQEFRDAVFYWNENKVSINGKILVLTKKEADLMRLLVRNRGKVVRKEDIIKTVWKMDFGRHSNVLQALVKRLRNKFGCGSKNQIICNVHGVGYRIDLETLQEEGEDEDDEWEDREEEDWEEDL